MNIYLAGPIDLVGADGQTWKKLLSAELVKHPAPEGAGQWTSFDPAAPFGLMGEFVHTPHRSRFIEACNRGALMASDAIVAYVSATKVSFGTPVEVEQVWELTGHPGLRKHGSMPCPQIFVLTDIPWGKSVYLQNRVIAREFYIDQQPNETVEAWLARAAFDISDLGREVHVDAQPRYRRSERDVMSVLDEVTEGVERLGEKFSTTSPKQLVGKFKYTEGP